MNVQNQIKLEDAVRDLVEIKQAIFRAERGADGAPAPRACPFLFYFNLALLAAAGVLFVCELALKHSITDVLYLSHYREDLRYTCIAALAALLFGVAGLLFYALRRAAAKNDESLSAYFARNFHSLTRLSLLSDLFVKFTAFSVAILSGRGDWVAPLLLIFTGDYLLQGRIFSLPLRSALSLGFACMLLGLYQLVFLDGTLLYPLAALMLVSGLSLLHIRTLRSRSTAV